MRVIALVVIAMALFVGTAVADTETETADVAVADAEFDEFEADDEVLAEDEVEAEAEAEAEDEDEEADEDEAEVDAEEEESEADEAEELVEVEATEGVGYSVSANGKKQMAALLAYAKKHNAGPKAFKGHCYHYVWNYLMKVPGGYGKLSSKNQPKQSVKGTVGGATLGKNYARYFADYFNTPAHAAQFGLQKLPIANPYDAPAGAIVVVGPKTPGTKHCCAGDITVVSDEPMPPAPKGHGYKGCKNCHYFINDGRLMNYHDPRTFAKSGGNVLGIFAPL